MAKKETLDEWLAEEIEYWREQYQSAIIKDDDYGFEFGALMALKSVKRKLVSMQTSRKGEQS